MSSHLGGYVPGGDAATFYPDLWAWLVNDYGVESVLDVGAGDGIAVDYFRILGANAVGIEGVPQDHPQIIEHDFTTGPTIYAEYDLVWCCEFVEHVEERYLPNYLSAFKAAPLVLLTHADPGQQGYHHVNCQPDAYWIGVMAAIGYAFNRVLTNNCRLLAAKNPSPWNHFYRSGLAFVGPRI